MKPETRNPNPESNARSRRRRWIVMALAVMVLGAGVVLRHRIKWWLGLGRWENVGDWSGSIERAAPRFDATKQPSRAWLDGSRTAPAPLTFHSYAASSIGGQETYYLLYLPPGYGEEANQSKRYPVVYWLHGYSVEPQYGTPFVEGMDAAIKAGKASPTIIVLPHGLYDSWYVDSEDGSQPVESVIIRDLIPHVDRTYRTIADRRGRALEGFSMGGWGALHLAFKYPEMFGAVTSVGAPFHRAENFPQLGRVFSGNRAAYYAEDPVTRARRHPEKLAGVRVRLLVGEKDGNLGFTRSFDKVLGTVGVAREVRIVPGVGHNDGDLYEKLGVGVFEFYGEGGR